MGRWRSHLLASVAALIAPAVLAQSQADDRLLQQREAFRLAYQRAELGDFSEARQQAALLQDYVLWPDLRAAWLKTRVRNGDYTEVDEFLDSHGVLKPARDLRYRYALELGRQSLHQRFLDIYNPYYQGLEVARLDCLALQAVLATGKSEHIAAQGESLWLVGRNQVEECDPIFDYLRDNGTLGGEQYQRRFELALQNRQFAMVRYLSRSLGDDYKRRAAQWTAVAGDPEACLRSHSPSRNSDDYRAQLLFAAEQLAYRQPELALDLWRAVRDQYPFSTGERNTSDRHLALWAARRHSDTALSALNAVADEATDTEVLRWQARAAMRSGDWSAVRDAIESMSAEDRQTDEWQYWHAIALQSDGQEDRHEQILSALARTRGFYAFLAADRLGRQYALAPAAAKADETLIASITANEQLVRARELFFVGLEGRGRSEWDAAISLMPVEEKRQAAILADRWGWHSRAIATAAEIGEYDDLSLRYPLPYRELFERHAGSNGVPASLAYGLARSESLFMRDIRSSAGAIGLMQLLPETGRHTARQLGVTWNGHATLTEPDSNIRLGTAYLRKMLDRFDGNVVLAAAAYNAGPLNVEAWLPEDGSIDASIWLANIPYNETRRYVARVLETNSIFQWRLTGAAGKVSSPLKSAIQAQQQIALND